MKRYTEKRRLRQIAYSKPVLVLLAIAAILLGRGAVEVVGKWYRSYKERVVVERELNGLREQEALLTERVGSLESDRGVEAELRSRFNVAKPGEEIIIIVDEEE